MFLDAVWLLNDRLMCVCVCDFGKWSSNQLILVGCCCFNCYFCKLPLCFDRLYCFRFVLSLSFSFFLCFVFFILKGEGGRQAKRDLRNVRTCFDFLFIGPIPFLIKLQFSNDSWCLSGMIIRIMMGVFFVKLITSFWVIHWFIDCVWTWWQTCTHVSCKKNELYIDLIGIKIAL